MFSSTFSSVPASSSIRPQGSWLSGLSVSTSTSTDTSSNTQGKRPSRGMTLPVVLTNPKEVSQGGPNDTESIGPQPIVTVASRLGVLGWFGSSSSIDNGVGVVGERPISDEPKTQVEEVAVERSEPVCPVLDKEEVLLERERQVESREKELEERKLVIDRREKELDDRSQELVDAEKKGEEAIQRKIEEVERRERELEERRGEFEEERKKWIEERNISNTPLKSLSPPEVESHTTLEWKNAMETLKKEMSVEISVERKKAEERELALETRVLKRVTEVLALDKDQQSAGWKKRWDILSIKPLTRKSTSSTASEFGI